MVMQDALFRTTCKLACPPGAPAESRPPAGAAPLPQLAPFRDVRSPRTEPGWRPHTFCLMTGLLLAAAAISDAPPSNGPAGGSGASVALDLFKLLAAAGAVAIGLRRVRIPVIPAYLITGAILGPSAFGLIADEQSVSAISSLAMVLLMFTIGMHLDPDALRGGMAQSLVVGVASTMVVAVAVTPLGMLRGLSAAEGLAVGMAVSMSSTAVVLQILQQRREMHRVHGRICVAVSITQDLLSLVFMAVMPVLAAAGAAALTSGGGADAAAHGGVVGFLPSVWPAWARAAAGILGIALLIVAGRFVLPPVLREATHGRSSDVMLVVAAAAALGSAIIAAGLGFSPELGAFLAGFLLAGTAFRHQLSGQLSPMRDLFMAVFFTAVGLKLDLAVVVRDWYVVLIGLVAIVAIKSTIIAACAWAAGATAPVAALSGLLLSQAGEFTIVVLTAGASVGLISDATMATVIAIVVLSLIATSGLDALGRYLQPRLMSVPLAGLFDGKSLREGGAAAHARTAPEPPAVSSTATPSGPGELASDPHSGSTPVSDHQPGASPVHAPRGVPLARFAIIAGYGVVGRALADRLEVAGIPFCIVDLNRSTVETQRRLRRTSVYGDISNPEVLQSAGVDRADAVFLTIPDDEATLRACQTIRAMRPEIFIAARTSFLSKAFAAQALGADYVVIEEVATAEMMARQVIRELEARHR